MKRRTFSICIVLSLLVVAFSFVMQQPANAQSPTATSTPFAAGDFGLITVTGNVRDVYGPTQICCQPTEGVLVNISASGLHGTSGGAAYTDVDGNYSISNIHLYDTDTVTARAEKDGFATSTIVRSGIATYTNRIFNFTLLPVTPTPYYTPTRSHTATRTATGPTPTRTRTLTPTRVSTANDVPYPDLKISSVTYLGSSPACANNPKVQVVVANVGAFPANGSFAVSLTGSAAQTVSGLAAGQSVTLIFNATGTTATADSTNSIMETIENNNSLTGSFGLPTQAPTCTPSGPTLTPTRTPTPVITNTPTQSVGACSPVTSTITIPFTFDGAGTFCWQASSLGGFINSWNTTSVSLNGMNVSNIWVGSGSYPAKIGGFYYVSYNSATVWGHFEAKP